MKTSISIEFTAEQEKELRRRVNTGKCLNRDAKRARIVLLLIEGLPVTTVAAMIGCTRDTVYKWAYRFSEKGCDGLADLPRSGRPPVFSPGSGGPSCPDCLPDA